MLDVLLAVEKLYFYVELRVNVLGHVLGAVDRTVLAAGAAEAHHQVGESAVDIPAHRCVHQCPAVVEEGSYLAVVFKEFYHFFVEACKGLVAFVFAGVVHGAAVEDKSAAVARCVVGDAFLVGKRHDFHGERALLKLVGELLHVYKLAEHGVEIGILYKRLVEYGAEVSQGKGHALEEVGLLLEVAAVAVSAKHLQGAEQHEMPQLLEEIFFVDGLVFF